jgi:hypothetical protein
VRVNERKVTDFGTSTGTTLCVTVPPQGTRVRVFIISDSLFALAFPFISSQYRFLYFIVLAASSRAMKALFKRFNRAQARAKDKVKDPMDSDSLSPPATSYQKEKPPQLPPLRDWPPPPPPLEQPERSTGTPTSITSHKPLPEHSSHPLPPLEPEVTLIPFTDYYPISISDSRGPLSDVAEEDSVATTAGNRTATPRADQDSAGRNSCKTGNGSITTTNGSIDVPTKVALHPPPLAPSDLNADRPLPEDASASNMSPVVRSQSSHPKDSTAASGSRPDVGSSENSTQTVKDTSSRSVTSPYLAKPAYGDGASIHQSLPSATPFSQTSIGSVLPPASSEGAGEDLVTHLGPRERARQGVLSEPVASEERYERHPCLLSRSVNCTVDMSPSCSR